MAVRKDSLDRNTVEAPEFQRCDIGEVTPALEDKEETAAGQNPKSTLSV